MNIGEDADLTKADKEYFSSNLSVATVENGLVTAYNAGSTDIYVKVTVDGIMLQSNTITIKVNVSIDSLNYLMDMYQKSRDIKEVDGI